MVTLFALDSCGRAPSLPTSPSAGNPVLTYQYAPTIPADYRQLAETALPEAIANLEDAMSWTLDHDITLDILDSPGPPTATGADRTITVHGRNSGWVHVSATSRRATIAHELFHLYQEEEGLTGPVWVREGAAEFFAFHSAYELAGTHTRSRILECNITSALRQSTPPLEGLDTIHGEFPYGYATVGIHFLLNGAGIETLNHLRFGGIEAFGSPATEFYKRFEDYRQSWQSTQNAGCSR